MASDRYAKQQALQSGETSASVIHAIMLQTFGPDVYDWDPITCALEVKAEFGVDMDTATLDRWCAMQIIMSTGAFFERLDAFLGICNTLAEGVPFFQVFDPVTVEEAAWAITEVSLNRELLPFSYPIRKYIRTILERDGYSEETWPEAFKEVFQRDPDELAIRRELNEIGDLDNKNNVESYIDEQLGDMVYQFNQIPELKTLDNMLLRRSMDEYIGELVQ